MQSNNYWSGTSYANNTDNAWNVNMNNGNVNNNNKSNNNYVWPVRSDNDAHPLFSFENIYRQYLACRRNKRSAVNPLAFELGAEENLLDLKRELDEGTYCPSRSVCFMATKPKLREIFAADFRDRIVHHILVDCLERIWESRFIHDSCACRRSRGIHSGVGRLRSFLRKATRNGTRRAWYLQLDIANFFMSIDKDILYALIAKKVKDEQVLRLARTVIFHDCTQDFVLKGDRGYLEKIAPHKSLFFAAQNRGLPIGNLTSQFFANLYLNELDRFVKHDLKCRHYLRYCDDFVLVSADREKLCAWKENIARFLGETLNLQLNGKRERLQPVSNGVDFLGYIVRPDYTLVRKRVVNNLRAKLDLFEKRLVRKERPPYVRVMYDHTALEQLRAVLASYLGHLKWANAFRLREALFERYGFIERFFSLEGGRLNPCFKAPGHLPSLTLQYRYFKTLFPQDVLLVQVGRYFELLGPDARVGRMLGLRQATKRRRLESCGFPAGLEKTFTDRLMRMGRTVTVVGEEKQYFTSVKQRVPRYRLAIAA